MTGGVSVFIGGIAEIDGISLNTGFDKAKEYRR
jgi:hypothetical protein